MRRIALLLATGLLLLLAAAAVTTTGPATALAAAPRTTLNDVEDELMCDTCNVPLNIAESERADQERAELRELIAQGLTKQQILDRFVANYGHNILANPKGGGAAVTVWAVPAAVIGGVLLGLLLLLPRWKRRRAAALAAEGPASEGPQLSDADALRLEQDLARYDL